MLQRNIATIVLAASLLVGTTGCQADVEAKLALAGLSSSCRVNSDCSAELVCVFERCHEQCSSSRDCDHAARCVAGVGKRNVCQLADEAGCSQSGSCPGSQVCAADAQCRDGCASNGECLADQVCVGGTCAEATEVNESGQLTPAADRPEAAPEPCAFDSDCPGDLTCVAGACAAQCQADTDCRAGETCRGARCQSLAPHSAGCLRNSDCSAAEVCVEGTCQEAPSVPKPDCAYDSECKTPGQHCTDGACRCECATDKDCSANQACEGSCRCIPNRILVGNVNVTNARQLQALADVVEITGQLTLSIPGYGEYHLPQLRKVGALSAFAQKTTIWLDALEEVSGMLSCAQDSRVPLLKSAGAVGINSQVIREVVFPALEAAGDFKVQYSPELERVSAPLLKSAKYLAFEHDPKLTSVELPQLEAVGAVSITNTGISSLDFLNPDISGSLTTAGDMSISFNPALPICALSALGTALAAKGWMGAIDEHDNLNCSCYGAVCL